MRWWLEEDGSIWWDDGHHSAQMTMESVVGFLNEYVREGESDKVTPIPAALAGLIEAVKLFNPKGHRRSCTSYQIRIVAPYDRQPCDCGFNQIRNAVAAAKATQLIEAQDCTGESAMWCPVHGDCECAHTDEEYHDVCDRDTSACPLHGDGSKHAAKATQPPPCPYCAWAEELIGSGIDLMTNDQIGQWRGVRAFQEWDRGEPPEQHWCQCEWEGNRVVRICGEHMRAVRRGGGGGETR